MSSKPQWQFPKRNGGIEFIQDPSSAYFSDDPLPKLVREVVQNSLDAKQPGLNKPVTVLFTESQLAPDMIGGSGLKKHLLACRHRAREDNLPSVQRHYQRALKALDQKRIRCLQIIDSGTTGLEGAHWNALVSQEGSVRKLGDAPGGSFGIGKNAVFNVSDLRTVFYSTRCLELGRVEKLQGKATLMAHSKPGRKDIHLQHTGFFAKAKMEPILTREIPDFFRLPEVGTGVFVMGFNPRSSNWEKEVATAVIENFFYAIHNKQLVVEVKSQKAPSISIDHENIDLLFDDQPQSSPSFHYYRAIREAEPVRTDEIGPIGPLNVFVLIQKSGPRRTAYVNSNGMLITDIRDHRKNPIAPRGRSLWPDFAAVVAPGTAEGDGWVRRTENPSHDSMSPEQLPEAAERRDARRWFKEAREAIRAIIDDKAQLDRYGDQTNLEELAAMFPDEFDPAAPGNRVLRTARTSARIMPSTSLPGSDSSQGSAPGKGSGPGIGPGSESTTRSQSGAGSKADSEPTAQPNPGSGSGTTSGSRPARPPRLRRPRFIPRSPSTATIAFTVPDEHPGQLQIALTPAGSEWRRESRVEITQASASNPPGLQVELQDGMVSLAPAPNDRVVLTVTTRDPISNLALRIG